MEARHWLSIQVWFLLTWCLTTLEPWRLTDRHPQQVLLPSRSLPSMALGQFDFVVLSRGQSVLDI